MLSKGSFTPAPGAEVWVRAPGSGGYGPAAARDAERLRDDVVNGYVSPEAALADYGYPDDPAALACPRCRPPTG